MFFFFFFQAEDGIRDLYVTGVQTCALPISGRRPRTSCARQASRGRAGQPPRPHGRFGRAPTRRRRGGGRVADSAGRYGERSSGAGLVEPKTPPLKCRGMVATAACRTVPRPGRGTSRAQGVLIRMPSRLADLQRSTQRASTSVSRGPGAAGGWGGDHGTGKVVVERPARLLGTTHLNA